MHCHCSSRRQRPGQLRPGAGGSTSIACLCDAAADGDPIHRPGQGGGTSTAKAITEALSVCGANHSMIDSLAREAWRTESLSH
eukprot:scaffold6436_cov113-Isochrysis_galbana.AAC.7